MNYLSWKLKSALAVITSHGAFSSDNQSAALPPRTSARLKHTQRPSSFSAQDFVLSFPKNKPDCVALLWKLPWPWLPHPTSEPWRLFPQIGSCPHLHAWGPCGLCGLPHFLSPEACYSHCEQSRVTAVSVGWDKVHAPLKDTGSLSFKKLQLTKMQP